MTKDQNSASQVFNIHFSALTFALLALIFFTNPTLADTNNSLHNPSTFQFPTQVNNDAGGITIDTSAPSPTGQTPLLDTSQSNNTPIINITTPTTGGVSVNNFTNFNIGTDGVVFNNSINYGTSILGGAIYGNPNFSSGGSTASIILNQVTGSGTSNLFGFGEVFGNKAELVIANQYGISCAGCGFINTGKISLVAGIASLQSDLSTIKMNTDVYNSSTGQGIIKIDGVNTNGSSGLSLDTSSIALIARSIDVARQLKTSGNIQMIVGKNQINYAKGDNAFHSIDSISQPTDNQTTVSLDTKNLGGIYGNTIFIESTESGAGVNFVSEVIAQNSMKIDANGNIFYNDLRSKGDMTLISSQNIGDIQIDTTGATGAKTKSNTVPTANFSWVDSIGNTYSKNLRISNNSQAYSEGNINITANNATNSGLIYSKGNINYNIKNNILNDYGTIYSEGSIFFQNPNNTSNTITNGINTNNFSNSFTNHMGYIWADGDITIKANTITNDREGIRANLSTGIADSHPQVIGQTITKHIYYDEEQDYRQSYLIANNNLNLNALTITNQGSKLSAGNDVNITANILNNNSQILQDDYNNYYMNWEVVKKKKWFSSGKLKTQYIYGWRPRNYWTYGYRYDPAQILAGNDINLNVTSVINNGTSAGHQNYNTIIDTSIKQTISTSSGTSSTGNGISQGDANTETEEDPPVDATHTLIDPLGDPNDPNNWAPDEEQENVDSGDPSANPNNAGTNSTVTLTIAENSSSPSTTRPITNINNILYDTNGALFKPANATSHYVVESKFANVSQFKGAEYLFSRLNIGYYDQELQNRRLMGDSYWEAMTIKTEYERLTNTQFNTDTADLSSKMQTLLDNAYNQKSDLKLTLGVGLSKEQVKNLKSDIIWYVNKDIINAQGVKETVLVPQLYLANNNNIILQDDGTITTNKAISSVISANKDVNIQSTNNLNNNLTVNNLGQIKTKDGNVNIAANSVTNYGITNENGEIKSGNDININLANNLYNLSGAIKADNNVNILAGGDILSQTLTKRTYFDVSGEQKAFSQSMGFEGMDYTDTLGNSASIRSNNSNVNLTANKSILLAGSNIAANKDININAKEGATITSVVTESKKSEVTTTQELWKDTINEKLWFDQKNHGSRLESNNGNINITSGNGLTKSNTEIYGSNLLANNGNVNLLSTGDTNISTTQDYSMNYEYNLVKKYSGVAKLGHVAQVSSPLTGIGSFLVGSLFAKKTRTEDIKLDEKITNNQSNIDSQNISILSGYLTENGEIKKINDGSNARIYGSNLTADELMTIVATGSIDISSVQDINSKLTIHQKTRPDHWAVLVGATAGAVGGAAGGAVAGLAVGNPGVGAIVGAVGGGIGGAIAGSNQVKIDMNGLLVQNTSQISSNLLANNGNINTISKGSTYLSSSNMKANNIEINIGSQLDSSGNVIKTDNTQKFIQSDLSEGTITDSIGFKQRTNYWNFAAVQFTSNFAGGWAGETTKLKPANEYSIGTYISENILKLNGDLAKQIGSGTDSIIGGTSGDLFNGENGDLSITSTNLQTGKENKSWSEKQTLNELKLAEGEQKSWWVNNRGSALLSPLGGVGGVAGFATEQFMIEILGMKYDKKSKFEDNSSDLKQKASEIMGSVVVK